MQQIWSGHKAWWSEFTETFVTEDTQQKNLT